jgi:hypothetical protein
MKLSSILVAINSLTGSRFVLNASVHLAHIKNAELKAVFIEESDWFEVSKFSFTQQISSYRGEVIPFTETNVTEQSRALGSLLQRMISTMSEKVKIKYSYKSFRGIVHYKLLELAMESDLVVIGRTRIPDRNIYKVGKTALYLAENSTVPLLIWNSGPAWPGSVTGLCTDPDDSLEVIDWVSMLARLLEQELKLYWPKRYKSDDEWDNLLNQLNKMYPELTIHIKNISEARPVLNPETDRIQTDQLLVFKRSYFQDQKMAEVLKLIPNSVLIL